jgi:hypothetical protein
MLEVCDAEADQRPRMFQFSRQIGIFAPAELDDEPSFLSHRNLSPQTLSNNLRLEAACACDLYTDGILRARYGNAATLKQALGAKFHE